MDILVRFGWQVLYRLERPFFGTLMGEPFFRISEPDNYFNRISASNPRLYHPVDFEPTNILHRRLRGDLASKFGVAIREKNFPYEINADSFGRRLTVSASVQAFFPDLVSVRIESHTFCPLDEAKAFDQRRFDNHPVLVYVANFLVGLLNTSYANGALTKRLQVRPYIRLHVAEEGETHLGDRRDFLVALLINDARYRTSNPAIFERVLQENAEHNQKGERARLILISKQGFLCLTTAGSDGYALMEQEIKKKERLFALGAVLSNFYDTYTEVRRDYVREMDYLFFATKPYIKAQQLTFKLSYSNTLAWSLIASEFKLTEAFDSVRRFDVDAPSVISHLFDQVPRPKYSSPAFWEQVDRFLGEDYVTKQSGDIRINIGTNRGAVAAGNQAQATQFQIDSDRFRQVIEEIAKVRAQLHDDQARTAEFDRLIVALRRESETPRPNLSALRQSFASLRNVVEGTVAGLAASGLLYEGAKLLGT